MQLKHLKVGDRVKYKYNGGIHKSVIEKIGNEHFLLNDDAIAINVHGFKWINKEDVIFKLEPIQEYKEIPIEKEEEKYYPYLCPKCHKPHGWSYYQGFIISSYCPECIDSWNKTIPETKYYCKNCKKYITGLSGFPMDDYTTLCKTCSDKEKAAPKSFKFDLFVKSCEGILGDTYGNYPYKANGLAIKDNKESDVTGIPAPEWIQLGKTYTIEIKEKE
jgi:hypothetical protein